MKKILGLIILAMTMVSCYEDYIKDYTYTGIYFPYQQDVRTFVVGEGMKIRVGVALGGIRENSKDRVVNYELRNSLINPAQLLKMQGASQPYIKEATAAVTNLLPMPTNYYTLSNGSNFVIKAGEHMGDIELRADSVNFLSDPATLNATYALPFYITDGDADSIVSSKRYNVIGFKYEQMLFGNYWHGGQALVNRPGNTDTTYNYFTEIPTPEVKIWTLKTVSPNSVVTNGYYDQAKPTGTEMILQLNGDQVTISSAPGSTWTIIPEGTSSYNNAKLLQNRKIFLKYKFTNTTNGFTYHCTDTITFRNRIRDGINEWQDENPSHYGK